MPHATMDSSPKMTDLAARISSNTALVEKLLHDPSKQQQGIDVLDGDEFPAPPNAWELQKARTAVLEDTKALLDSILGPGEVLRRMCWIMIDLAVLKVIYRFKIPSAVPLDTPISYIDLAARVDLPVIRLRSLLRQSALNGIFAETADEDKVEHTRLSRILVHNTTLNDWVGNCVEDCLPACDRLADALEQYSDSHAPEDSAFSLAFGIREPMFSFVEKDPERQRRMFGAMQGISNAPGHSFDHIVEGYPWKQFKDADIVDVGGSTGFLSVCLAKAYPEMGNFIVQDLADTINQGEAQLAPELRARINFVAHDIFHTQPAVADVYILRHICHDWPDDRAAAIVANLLPAMKPTSKILLIELVVRPPGVANGLAERYVRNVDMTMLTLLNTQERSESHWREVVAKASPDLDVLSVNQPPGSWDSVIEIGFKTGQN